MAASSTSAIMGSMTSVQPGRTWASSEAALCTCSQATKAVRLGVPKTSRRIDLRSSY
jgi:hypothetical protein